jgi:hypothetical protein
LERSDRRALDGSDAHADILLKRQKLKDGGGLKDGSQTIGELKTCLACRDFPADSGKTE